MMGRLMATKLGVVKQIATVAVAVGIVCTAVSSQKQRKPTEITESIKKFAWSVDTRTLGFADDPILEKVPRLATFPEIFFLSDSNLAVTFLTREVVAGLQKRDDPSRQLPYKLHLISLDPSTGKERWRLDWSNDDANIGAFPRSDGSFMVLSRTRLSRYSPDGQMLKTIDLPPKQNGALELIGADSSPTGNSLMIRYRAGKTLTCDWVSAADLSASPAECELSYRLAVCDQGLAIVGPMQNRPREFEIQVQMRNQPWKSLCDTRSVGGCGVPHFFDNRLLLTHTNKELDLINTDGETMMSYQVATGRGEVMNEYEPISASRSLSRIAVTISRTEGTRDGMMIDWSDVFFRAKVYDTRSRAWIYDLENDTRPDPLGNGRDLHPFKTANGLALSLDGKQLVLEVDGKVQSYQLPEISEVTPGTPIVPDFGQDL